MTQGTAGFYHALPPGAGFESQSSVKINHLLIHIKLSVRFNQTVEYARLEDFLQEARSADLIMPI